MAVKKKSSKKARAAKPTAKKRTPLRKATKPFTSTGIALHIASIEKTVKRTLDIVEFLEAEIIKARDANSEDTAKKETESDEPD